MTRRVRVAEVGYGEGQPAEGRVAIIVALTVVTLVAAPSVSHANTKASPGPVTSLSGSAYLFGPGFWRVFGCIGTIGATVGGNAVLVKKLVQVAKDVSGLLKLGRKLVAAGRRKKLEILAGIFGEMSGISGIVAAC